MILLKNKSANMENEAMKIYRKQISIKYKLLT